MQGSGPTRLLCLTLAVAVSAGCLPRTFVRKNPAEHDRGIRYYRPKPYLAIRPHVTRDGIPSDEFVDITLEYLPDFSEEYSIHVRSGLGINETSIALDQGWNLTAINMRLDSQTDENIEAVGNLARGIGSAATALTQQDGTAKQFAVRATNVPMGYYEAVLGNYRGSKQLYGFRYVGFFPYASCPLVGAGGPEVFCCEDGPYGIYGLVFENGVMTFKPLGSIAELENSPELNAVGEQGSTIERLPVP